MKHIVALLIGLFLFSAAEGFAQSRRLMYAPRDGSWRIGLEGGVGVLGDDNTRDSKDYHFRPLGGVELSKLVNQNIAIGIYGTGGMLRSTTLRREANTDFLAAGFLTEFRAPLLRGALYPLLQIRGGVLSIAPELRMDDVVYSIPQRLHLSWSLAAGFEVVSGRNFGVRALLGVAYTSTDRWDLLVQGDDRDGYSFAQLGVTWYFGSRRR
ncbi:MAG: hypothetical protein M5R41_07400 [Bacteroidia bacterium]|nr:hypothetical protein [Bacteroidia bacterium]